MKRKIIIQQTQTVIIIITKDLRQRWLKKIEIKKLFLIIIIIKAIIKILIKLLLRIIGIKIIII
jgi:hypothetical protein